MCLVPSSESRIASLIHLRTKGGNPLGTSSEAETGVKLARDLSKAAEGEDLTLIGLRPGRGA